MSYGIIRVQKFKAQGVRGIQSHDHRERESRTNPDIDKEKTPLNYSLQPCENYNQAVQNRLKSLESNKAVRKDAVVMCQLLVTSDSKFFENLTPPKQEAFFKQSLDFIANRYGKKNILSATVHMDEKTPHMHVNMTPVKGSRLTAKTLFDRNELRDLHTDFHRSVGQFWGLQRGESREDRRRHLDTEAFKLQMRKEQLQKQYKALAIDGPLIRPDELKPRVLEKKMFGLSKTEETLVGVADRLNETHIKPLALKTNEALAKLNGMHELKERHDRTLAELAAYRRDFTDGLRPEQVQQLKGTVQNIREKNRVELEFSKLMKKLPGTVGQHIEATERLMAEWEKAVDKKAFEEKIKVQFKREKTQDRGYGR